MSDDNDTNKISFRNLTHVAMELGENNNDEEMQDTIKQVDGNGSGEVNVDAYESYRIIKKKGNFLLEDLSSNFVGAAASPSTSLSAAAVAAASACSS